MAPDDSASLSWERYREYLHLLARLQPAQHFVEHLLLFPLQMVPLEHPFSVGLALITGNKTQPVK